MVLALDFHHLQEGAVYAVAVYAVAVITSASSTLFKVQRISSPSSSVQKLLGLHELQLHCNAVFIVS